MKIPSALSKEKYLSSLKRNMSAHSEFGAERFTGFFAGRFFYVTHHCGYEWNRKITNQKNAAFGYVKESENGCEVHFIRFRGAFCPMVFLPLFLVLYAASVALFLYVGLQEFYGIGGILLISLAIAGPILAISLPIATFWECLTEKSENGRRLLLSMLRDPTNPKENLPYIP